MALLPGKLTPQLQAWLVRLSAWLPFQPAADLLADLTRVRVSAATARRYTLATGAAYVAHQTADATAVLAHQPTPPPQAERVVLSVDGALVPLVHGEWAEVKTLAVGELPAGTSDGHVTALSYFSRLTDADTFGHLALSETYRRGVLTAPTVAAVTDGADWIQGFVDLHRPDALRILDFAHAAQRLTQIGQALWGNGSDQAQTWTTAQCHQLKHAGPRSVVAEVLRQQVAYPQCADLPPHLTYLTKRVGHLDYPRYQQQGWPIGSGIVESANKLVVEARLKGSGMHWARANVNPMLALRNVVCNDRWAEGWTVGQARRRTHVGARQHVRRQQAQATLDLTLLRSAAPPRLGTRPPSAPDGPPRPALNHPWRRPCLPHRRHHGDTASTKL